MRFQKKVHPFSETHAPLFLNACTLFSRRFAVHFFSYRAKSDSTKLIMYICTLKWMMDERINERGYSEKRTEAVC